MGPGRRAEAGAVWSLAGGMAPAEARLTPTSHLTQPPGGEAEDGGGGGAGGAVADVALPPVGGEPSDTHRGVNCRVAATTETPRQRDFSEQRNSCLP